MTKQRVGIMGGMGPLATVDLLGKIVNMTKADSDNEHIHIIADLNTNIPNRADAILYDGADPLPEMIRSAERLVTAGAEFLVIACNTAHHYYYGVTQAVRVPVIHMLKETSAYCNQNGIKTVGLLATDMVLKTGLYHEALTQEGIEILLPSAPAQQEIMRLIFDGVKKGNFSLSTDVVRAELTAMQQRGAEAFILGCTELPIAFERYGLDVPTVDPTQVLAMATILGAGYELA